MKAYTTQRLCAIIIDIFLLMLFSYLVNALIPYNNTYKSALDENNSLAEKYINKEINEEQYLDKMIDNQYTMSKNSIVNELAGVVLYVAYFVAFQQMNNGQTPGKKLMKIRVKKKDNSELTYSDLIKREFLIHGMAVSIIISILLLTVGKPSFAYYYYPIVGLNLLIFVLSSFMIVFKKDGRGLHDLFANTEVVTLENNENKNKEEIIDAEIIEERSDKDERINRTRTSKKRESKRDSKTL